MPTWFAHYVFWHNHCGLWAGLFSFEYNLLPTLITADFNPLHQERNHTLKSLLIFQPFLNSGFTFWRSKMKIRSDFINVLPQCDKVWLPSIHHNMTWLVWSFCAREGFKNEYIRVPIPLNPCQNKEKQNKNMYSYQIIWVTE